MTSAAFEVLAWNDLAAALMEDFAELAPEDRNLARRAFLGPGHAGATLYGVSDAAEFRHHVVMELRSTLARYPSDPAVTGLVEELRDGSPEFARLWERHDVQAAPMLTKTFRHPVVGEITVDCDSLTLTGPRPAPRALQRAARIPRRRGPGSAERARRRDRQRERNALSRPGATGPGGSGPPDGPAR